MKFQTYNNFTYQFFLKICDNFNNAGNSLKRETKKKFFCQI